MRYTKDELLTMATWQFWFNHAVAANVAASALRTPGISGPLSVIATCILLVAAWKLSQSVGLTPWLVPLVYVTALSVGTIGFRNPEIIGWALLFALVIDAVALLVLNTRANRALRAAGVPIGFMGAKPQDVIEYAKVDS